MTVLHLLPTKTYAMKTKACHGGEQGKE